MRAEPGPRSRPRRFFSMRCSSSGSATNASPAPRCKEPLDPGAEPLERGLGALDAPDLLHQEHSPGVGESGLLADLGLCLASPCHDDRAVPRMKEASETPVACAVSSRSLASASRARGRPFPTRLPFSPALGRDGG